MLSCEVSNKILIISALRTRMLVSDENSYNPGLIYHNNKWAPKR